MILDYIKLLNSAHRQSSAEDLRLQNDLILNVLPVTSSRLLVILNVLLYLGELLNELALLIKEILFLFKSCGVFAEEVSNLLQILSYHNLQIPLVSRVLYTKLHSFVEQRMCFFTAGYLLFDIVQH